MMWCYVMFFGDVVLCYVVFCDVTLCDMVLCDVVYVYCYSSHP